MGVCHSLLYDMTCVQARNIFEPVSQAECQGPECADFISIWDGGAVGSSSLVHLATLSCSPGSRQFGWAMSIIAESASVNGGLLEVT